MHINSEQFTKMYGNLYIIPKKISQDIVESFFSSQTGVWRISQYDWLYLRL